MHSFFIIFSFITVFFLGCSKEIKVAPKPLITNDQNNKEIKVEMSEEAPKLIPAAPPAPYVLPIGSLGGGGSINRFKSDKDHDLIPNDQDNCPSISNFSQDDFDCDGVGDKCDRCEFGNDTVDLDGNDIPDDCETPIQTLADETIAITQERTTDIIPDPIDWEAYKADVEQQGGGSEPLFENENEIIYTKTLHRFKKICEYDPQNASSLCEINFNVSIASGEQNDNLPPPNDFDQAIPIKGINPISNVEEIFAYIFTSSKLNMVVLSFTGTETLGQLVADLFFIQVPPAQLENTKPGMLVELGFYEIYTAINDQLNEIIPDLLSAKTQFIISGHSLGGALTTLAALDLAQYHPIVYSFASPRVGNPNFAQSFNEIPILSNTWRIFNTEDFVTTLPFPVFPLGIINPPNFIYEHVGNPVPFTINLKTLITNHIEAYRLVFINCNAPDNPNGICPNRFDCSQKKCQEVKLGINSY